MRPKLIWDVTQKEILSVFRDRRAIVSNLLIPLLILPVMMLGLPLLIGGLFEREQETVSEVGVVGLEFLPSALEQFILERNVNLNEVSDAETAVRSDDFQVAVVIPEGLETALQNGSPASLTIYQKTGNLRSELNASKIESAIDAYRQQIVGTRLREAGLDPSILEPISTKAIDASSEAERSSGQLSWLIPFFIAIWTLTGGQMAAIDATAGEKERGTLEALLVSPVRRSEVVVGKYIATLTFGLLSATMAILGYIVGGIVLGGIFSSRLSGDGAEIAQAMGGSLSITPMTVFLLLFSSLLLAGLIAALLISITMFARSFKEAQSYVAPMSFLLIVPALLIQFKDLLDLGQVIYFVPIVNVLFLMDDVVRGNATLMPIALTWLTLIVLTSLLLAFAHRNFQREGVIFRT